MTGVPGRTANRRSFGSTGLVAGMVDFGEVVEAAAQGHRWAVDCIATEYLGRLSAFARKRGAADPDGVADVALYAVLSRLDQLRFEAPEQLWAYLCLTARSRIIDAQRAARPIELVDDRAVLDHRRGDSRGFDDQVVDRALVADLLSPLTAEQRRVMELRFLEDRSIEETAHLTGRTTGAVKGLQRRAINAIIAAVAVVLAVVAVRQLSGDGVTIELDGDPADQVDGDEPSQENSNPPQILDVDVDDGSEADSIVGDDRTASTITVDPEPDVNSTQPTTGSLEQTESSLPGPTSRYVVTVGTDRQTSLDASGAPVAESNHGARNYCAASHFANGDPFAGDTPGTGPARIHWGNTVADADATSFDLTAVGSATCEGGVADRSAYWMPALFNGDDEIMLPELILVEYKAFGGGAFDRNALGPIPAGLHLVASADIGYHIDRYTRIDGQDQIRLKMLFPSCVATDGDGRPRLTAERPGAHLSYPSPDADGPTECPPTHPYRIPTLNFTVVYDVAVDDAWYLASADGRGSSGAIEAGAISAWQPAAMEEMVTCVRDLIGDCGFVGVDESGDPQYRGQLPERFVGPSGQQVYRNSVTLADGVDRTPAETGIVPLADHR